MARVELGDRIEFVNNTEGYVGALQYAPNGDQVGVAVEPGGTVWLSPEEQTITAKAPRKAEDNPFIPQRVEILDPDTGKKVGERYVTPLTPNTEERPIPGNNNRPIPGNGKLRPEAERFLAAEGDAPEGSHAPDEEVGTPAAQKPPAKRARRKAPVKSK